MTDFDAAIIGGGVLGSSIAYGLIKRDKKVLVLDGDDTDLRASRGNFGLVWLQCKGLDFPRYAEVSYAACEAWKSFSSDLEYETGIDIDYRNDGGLVVCFSEQEMADRESQYGALRESSKILTESFRFEALNNRQLKKILPTIGPTIPGAMFSEHDGHCNPLLLLRALHKAILKLGGTMISNCRVDSIKPSDGGFLIGTTDGQKHATAKTMITAGLGATELAPMVGLQAPLEPMRGQILVTERLAPIINTPTLYARQTSEGTVMLGGSNESVGYDESTSVEVLCKIAQQAVRTFPLLESAKIVRAWGALRIMTPDGLPIYQQSETNPGSFLLNCHSGITLASLHATVLADGLAAGHVPAQLECFSGDRFDA